MLKGCATTLLTTLATCLAHHSTHAVLDVTIAMPSIHPFVQGAASDLANAQSYPQSLAATSSSMVRSRIFKIYEQPQ
jgi:hypothetical protein